MELLYYLLYDWSAFGNVYIIRSASGFCKSFSSEDVYIIC